MGIFDDDETPRSTTSGIVVGEPLSNLSIHELNERLEQLKEEIKRVENENQNKVRNQRIRRKLLQVIKQHLKQTTWLKSYKCKLQFANI